MKTLFIKISSILLLLCLITAGCKKEDTLPLATQEGLNTFGMLVNGQIWNAGLNLSFVSQSLDCQYQTQTKQLSITAKNPKRNESITLFVERVRSVGYYNFSRQNYIRSQDTTCRSCLRCLDYTTFLDVNGCNNPYRLKDTINSILHISKLDTLRTIVSGTFSLIFVNSDSKLINISDGRFDLTY
jgi:hypothetical protein